MVIKSYCFEMDFTYFFNSEMDFTMKFTCA
jgi:hypothetical protein